MRLSVAEAVDLEDRSEQFIVESESLVEQLRALDVIVLLIGDTHSEALSVGRYQLVLLHVFEGDEVTLVLVLLIVELRRRG